MSTTAMQRQPDHALAIGGTFRDPAALTAKLAEIQQHYHLVAPATSCGQLPEGCGVALSVVTVDIDRETYPVGGGGDDDGTRRGGMRGLGKSVLDRIAAASGISWDPILSRRLDSGRDPRYCHFKAVGRYRQFDGSIVEIADEKEMDLRDGSPQVVALEERARKKNRSAATQVRELRLHILGHAVSKARLRAIRSLGIRTSYSAEELQKPFVIAKFVWTGQTDDPELRRAFALKQADAMIGGTRALYGGAPALPPPAIDAHDYDAPIVPESEPDVDAHAATERAPRESPPPAPPPPKSEPRPAAAAPPAQQKTAPSRQRDIPTVPFGKNAGTPITDVDDEELDFLLSYSEKAVADPKKARWREDNERMLGAVREEIAIRAAGGEVGP